MNRAAPLQMAYIRRRMRPLRFGFLVSPTAENEFLRAVEASTTLWGGRYNPIIPFSTDKIADAEGYLEALDPDLVVYQGQKPSSLSVSEHRLLSIEELLEPDDSEPAAFRTPPPGVSVVELYNDWYRNELRYLHDGRPTLTKPVGKGEDAAFAAACFGRFPQGQLRYVDHAFERLGAELQVVSQDNFCDILLGSLDPLKAGAINLWARRGPPIWFLWIKHQRLEDLIWLWNLRSVGVRVFPIRDDWADSLLDRVNEIICEHEPQPGMLPNSTSATLLGRREYTEELEGFADKLKDTKDRLLLQPWLPRLWDRRRWTSDHIRRVTPYSKEDDSEAFLHDDETLRFKSLSPEFVRSKIEFVPRWANEISFNLYERWDLAEVFPRGLPDEHLLLTKDHSRPESRIGIDGHVALCHTVGERHFWNVPTGAKVIADWLRGQNVIATPSDAGRIADELIRVLDGPRGIGRVAHPRLLELFEKTQRSETRSVRYKPLLGELKRIHENRRDVAERHLRNLIKSNVLELGMDLKCDVCLHSTWLSLEALREETQCACCLRTNRFPLHKPPKNVWSYRLKGPFALSGHAKGAYVVASALSFLKEFGTSTRTSWATSLELQDGADKLEADFAVLWQGGLGDEPPIPVFGECKTFDIFESHDIQKMKKLGERLPGSVLAFCTYRKELTCDEKKEIGELAEWGRTDRRTPVVVLTLPELTSISGPPYCWKDGSAIAQKVAARARHFTELNALCDATQQIYLGLSPSERWPHHAS